LQSQIAPEPEQTGLASDRRLYLFHVSFHRIFVVSSVAGP
jgi:hypothetical protein